jgi:hypothetical protein
MQNRKQRYLNETLVGLLSSLHNLSSRFRATNYENKIRNANSACNWFYLSFTTDFAKNFNQNKMIYTYFEAKCAAELKLNLKVPLVSKATASSNDLFSPLVQV